MKPSWNTRLPADRSSQHSAIWRWPGETDAFFNLEVFAADQIILGSGSSVPGRDLFVSDQSQRNQHFPESGESVGRASSGLEQWNHCGWDDFGDPDRRNRSVRGLDDGTGIGGLRNVADPAGLDERVFPGDPGSGLGPLFSLRLPGAIDRNQCDAKFGETCGKGERRGPVVWDDPWSNPGDCVALVDGRPAWTEVRCPRGVSCCAG